MKRRRSSIVLISLVFGTGREALGSELERLIAPKLLRGGVTSKPEEMEADLYSQHMHKGIKIEPRIVGGSNVDPNVYPFFTRIDTSGFPYCGGSLVAPDVVLTAGHCYTSDDALSVVVNGTELYYSNGPFRYKRDVDYSVRHPGFNPTTYENDAMLLKLSSPVSDVQYISINFDNENPQVGDDLTVMGLGNKQEDGAPADTLQAVTVQAIAHDICKAAYTAAGLRDRVDEEIMLCAGNFREGGRDACQGDSGGPLIDGNGVQVGIVSWGLGCGRSQLPGIYSRTSGLKGWINENICIMSDDPPNWCSDVNLALANDDPTVAPAREPPTPFPTLEPTLQPTIEEPTLKPSTEEPTSRPTNSPSIATLEPSQAPISTQTDQPTMQPTKIPTEILTESPTFGPTTRPTQSPIAPPTRSPTDFIVIDAVETRTCQDHDKLFELGDQRGGETCEWLRNSDERLQDWFCVPGTDAWNICEATCGKCVDSCVDSDTAVFSISGVTGVSEEQNCAWLDATQSMQAQLCVPGSDAHAMCKRTCGTCSAPPRNHELEDEIRPIHIRPPVLRDSNYR